MATETCTLDIHKEIWDLTGTLTAEWYDKNNPQEPLGVIHADQTLVVKVTLTLAGRILHYLCNTKVGCKLAFESCGPGPESQLTPVWKTITPCQADGNVIVFEFDVEPGYLTTDELGTEYELCITVGSKDCCGVIGFIYGTCHDISITVLPADVN